jgi:hypothetical protein
MRRFTGAGGQRSRRAQQMGSVHGRNRWRLVDADAKSPRRPSPFNSGRPPTSARSDRGVRPAMALSMVAASDADAQV